MNIFKHSIKHGPRLYPVKQAEIDVMRQLKTSAEMMAANLVLSRHAIYSYFVNTIA